MDELLSVFVPGLAWSLLDFVWQGLIVGWGAALVLGLLRKARPQLRYLVACGALLLCAALPAAGLVQRLADHDAAQAVMTTTLPLAHAGNAAATLPVQLAGERLAGWEQALQARLPLFMLFWACGVALLALRMMAGLAWVRRRSQRGQYQENALWQARLDRLATRLGIASPVRLGVVGDLASPVTAGWWRPVVLLPAALVSGMPPELIEALLAHELAHIKRHDYLVNLVQGAIEIVLFYHPTVWWLSNRIRVEREQIADDVAASMLGEPRRLALALSQLDQFQFTPPQLAHAAHGGNLMSRIKRLVRPDTEPLNWKMAIPILGLAAACAAFYAQAQSTPAAPAKAAQAAPAAEKSPRSRAGHEHLTINRGNHDLAYALVRGTERNGSTMSGSSDDWSEISAAKDSVPGDFLWFRKGGKAYIVQDPGVLARVIEAWAPVDRLGAVMDEHGKQMDEHGKLMEALGKEMEAAAQAYQPNEGELRKFERDIAKVSRDQDRLSRELERKASKMAAASADDRARLERETEQLAKEMEKMASVIAERSASLSANHEKMSKAAAPMEAIGEKMREAGKPMEALGAQMGELGKQMEKESATADKTMRGLIDESLTKGLAQPAPSRKAG